METDKLENYLLYYRNKKLLKSKQKISVRDEKGLEKIPFFFQPLLMRLTHLPCKSPNPEMLKPIRKYFLRG